MKLSKFVYIVQFRKRYVAFTIDETQFCTFVLHDFRFSLAHMERMVLAFDDDVRWRVSEVKKTEDEALSNPGSLCLTTSKYAKRRRYSVSGRQALAAPYFRSVLCSMNCRRVQCDAPRTSLTHFTVFVPGQCNPVHHLVKIAIGWTESIH